MAKETPIETGPTHEQFIENAVAGINNGETAIIVVPTYIRSRTFFGVLDCLQSSTRNIAVNSYTQSTGDVVFDGNKRIAIRSIPQISSGLSPSQVFIHPECMKTLSADLISWMQLALTISARQKAKVLTDNEQELVEIAASAYKKLKNDIIGRSVRLKSDRNVYMVSSIRIDASKLQFQLGTSPTLRGLAEIELP